MAELTELERRAVVNALEWLRADYDAAYAIERGIKGPEVGALTRAIRKLGGNPHPESQPLTTEELCALHDVVLPASLQGMLDGARAAARAGAPRSFDDEDQVDERRQIGFNRG